MKTFGLLLLGWGLAVAQTTGPSGPLRFDAATIKLNGSGAPGINNKFDPQRFAYTNVPAKVLIENAYKLKDYQIIGSPSWLGSDRWDVSATTDGPMTPEQQWEMVKSLFAERFKLAFHKETRDLPVYVLTATKSGPKFQTPNPDDNTPGGGFRIQRGSITAHKFDVSRFATLLGDQLNLPLIDKAGLKGIYDFKLEWTPMPGEGFEYRDSDGNPMLPPDPGGPSIFSALQEQLGLKLEASKGPVEVFIIDHIERPIPN